MSIDAIIAPVGKSDLSFDLQADIIFDGNAGRFIYSQSFCQKSAEWKSPKKYFSYFIFDDWHGIRTQALASNKPTHYLLDPREISHILL